jgi:hypothetical protein
MKARASISYKQTPSSYYDSWPIKTLMPFIARSFKRLKEDKWK